MGIAPTQATPRQHVTPPPGQHVTPPTQPPASPTSRPTQPNSATPICHIHYLFTRVDQLDSYSVPTIASFYIWRVLLTSLLTSLQPTGVMSSRIF